MEEPAEAGDAGTPGTGALERLRLRQAVLETELARLRRRIAAAGAPIGRHAASGTGAEADDGAGGAERLRVVLASVMGYAVFTIDAAGVITGWNPGAEMPMG